MKIATSAPKTARTIPGTLKVVAASDNFPVVSSIAKLPPTKAPTTPSKMVETIPPP